MTRRDWWFGVAIVAAAVVAHAAFPRYEWRPFVAGRSSLLVRVDRWTGSAQLGDWKDGRWSARDVPKPLGIVSQDPLDAIDPPKPSR